MDNAQNVEDWGIQQMEVANARIPYASTLVQLEDPPHYGLAPNGIAYESGHLGGPSLPNPQPFVRGEKQWMDNAQNIEDWGIQQMEVANARIPYASTLIQLDDEEKDEETAPKKEAPKKLVQKEDEPDYSLLYEKEKKSNTPEKVMALTEVPMNA